MALPKTRTELDDYLKFGVCPRDRRIFFGQTVDSGFDADEELTNNGFTQSSVELAVRAIKRMESDHPSKPIELYMNSYGGDSYAMLYLVDVILSSPCQFKFFGGGAIMSSATWVMAVCDERYLYPNSKVMVHNGYDGTVGRYDDLHIFAAESKRHMEQLIDIYTENSRMPRRFWQDVCKRDMFLTATEAIQTGLADSIVEPKRRGSLRKKRRSALAKHPSANVMKKLTKALYDRIDIGVNLTDFSVHVPAEKEDPTLIIDETPVEPVQENIIHTLSPQKT